MSLLLLVVSALHILILILLFVATLDKVSLWSSSNRASTLLQTPDIRPSSKVTPAPPLSPAIYPSQLCL